MQRSIEFLPEQSCHSGCDGVGFVPRRDNGTDAHGAMLTSMRWKNLTAQTPEPAAREDNREPQQKDDKSGDDRKCRHSVVILRPWQRLLRTVENELRACANIARMSERISGFRGEFLWEWEIAERQLLQLANTFEAGDYGWHPNPTARAVSAVFVHVACGTFMLLEQLGTTAPEDLYRELPQQPVERLWAMVRRNDELEAGLREKEKVVPLLSRALASARETITRTDDADLERSLFFFDEHTTVRRVYLRLVAHTHEHMGQLIAYLRVRGMPAPWLDWRPDRRT
jgi:hypothetical protein